VSASRSDPSRRPSGKIRVSLASAAERDAIYRMRHSVYAKELGQHRQRADARLIDSLDAFNHYIAATVRGVLAGFVSITPPGHGSYSIDKYLARDELPFPVDDGLFEIRILTVDPAFRGSPVAGILMYASLRWVEDHGGSNIVLIGRTEVAKLYERVGMRRLGRRVESGAVTFELMGASIAEVQARAEEFAGLLRRLRASVDWALTIPFARRPSAFHGGASQNVLGVLPSREQRSSVITADVLDAWFPPAPAVRTMFEEDPDFLSMASPPTDASELREAIATSLEVDPASIAVGAGLSDLIFRCLPRLLAPTSRVLLVEPLYGEYRHVLQTLVGCQIDRVVLSPDRDTSATLHGTVFDADYTLVVIVDPNNPLGYRLDLDALVNVVDASPGTRFWIDRTYAPFADSDRSLERLASRSSNLIVATSMSKAYALSGLRVGYLCGPVDVIADAWRTTPPWLISRPAGAAAVAALADPAYYARRYLETAALRTELTTGLARIRGVRPRPSVANFILCELDPPLDASTVVERAAARDLYVRGFPSDPYLRWRAIRIGVKDQATQVRIVAILEEVIEEVASARRRAAVAT
jgi:histidinol-phosphate/aromatic aminotransferase/cobyric acid decarboxylase-like protein/ribosomal protein S18 acetylase RimI-like enzyme